MPLRLRCATEVRVPGLVYHSSIIYVPVVIRISLYRPLPVTDSSHHKCLKHKKHKPPCSSQ
jgi:hypothetical protein